MRRLEGFKGTNLVLVCRGFGLYAKDKETLEKIMEELKPYLIHYGWLSEHTNISQVSPNKQEPIRISWSEEHNIGDAKNLIKKLSSTFFAHSARMLSLDLNEETAKVIKKVRSLSAKLRAPRFKESLDILSSDCFQGELFGKLSTN